MTLEVAIVAMLPRHRIEHAVSTRLVRREARRAAVAHDRVAVVAPLAGIRDRVAAACGQAGVPGARRVTRAGFTAERARIEVPGAVARGDRPRRRALLLSDGRH